MCKGFGEKIAQFGKKVFDVVRNNVKVGVDVKVQTPITNDMSYHITSDQVANKIEDQMNKNKKKEIIHPVYFMSDEESRRVQNETNWR